MYLEQLAPAWRDFQRKLLAQTKILIVDDEEVILELLSEIFGGEGFTVTAVGSAEDAWERIQNERFDLAIVDKNLPGESGLDLIERIGVAGIALPSVLITAYASAETIAEALAKGASDYISKPFDDVRHLVARVRSVIDRRVTRLLFDVIARDLTRAMQMGGANARAFTELGRELLAFKLSLGRRPHVIVCDDNDEEADALAAALEADGMTTVIADSRGELLEMVGRDDGPLAVAMALESDDAIENIARLRANDPQIEILVVAARGSLRRALDAVSAGASDFLLRGDEGERALTTRIGRLVGRSRRHRLYLHLVATLYRAAKEVNPDLAADLVFAAPDGAEAYLESQPRASSGREDSGAFRLDRDFVEGDAIEGDPLGSRPLTHRPRDREPEGQGET